MAYTNPTIAEFKVYFARDFIYGSTEDTVNDVDIVKAQAEGLIFINQDLFINQSSYTIGMLYLEAHLMCINLQESNQGINGTYPWITNSKAVGNVSEGFAIPQRIQDDPEYAFFTKTYYGAKYMSIILPLLNGVMFPVWGRTNP